MMHYTGPREKDRTRQAADELRTKESSLCFREDLLLPIEASPVSAHCHDALEKQRTSCIPGRVHSAFARTCFCPLRHPQFQCTVDGLGRRSAHRYPTGEQMCGEAREPRCPGTWPETVSIPIGVVHLKSLIVYSVDYQKDQNET